MLMLLSMYAPRFQTEVDASTVTSPSLNGSRLNVFPRLRRAPDELCFGRIYLKPIRLCPVCDLTDA